MSGKSPAVGEALKALQRRGATVERLERMVEEAKARRMREIHAAYAAGAPVAVIGRAARLTPGRVSQIVTAPPSSEEESK